MRNQFQFAKKNVLETTFMKSPMQIKSCIFSLEVKVV